MNKSVIAVLVGLAVTGGAYAVADSKADAVALERADAAITSFNEKSGLDVQYTGVNANLLSSSFEISGLSLKKNDGELSINGVTLSNPVFSDDEAKILQSATVSISGVDFSAGDEMSLSVDDTAIEYNAGDKEITLASLERMDPMSMLSLFQGLNIQGLTMETDDAEMPSVKFKEISFSNLEFNKAGTMLYGIDSFVKGAEMQFDLENMSKRDSEMFAKLGFDSGKFTYNEELHYSLNPKTGEFNISAKAGMDDMAEAGVSLSLANFPDMEEVDVNRLQRNPMRAMGLFEDVAIKSFTFTYEDDGLAAAAYTVVAEDKSYKLESKNLPVTGEAYRKMMLADIKSEIEDEGEMTGVEEEAAEFVVDLFSTHSPDVKVTIEAKDKDGVKLSTLLKGIGGKNGADKAAKHFKYTMKAK